MSDSIGIFVPGISFPIFCEPGFSKVFNIIFSSRPKSLIRIAALPGKALAGNFPYLLYRDIISCFFEIFQVSINELISSNFWRKLASKISFEIFFLLFPIMTLILPPYL